MLLKKENKKLNKSLIQPESESRPDEPKSHIFFELKQKVKQLESALNEKNQELVRAKQSIKYTKIQELEAENQNFLDENFRLKSLLLTSNADNSQKKTTIDIAKEDQFLLQHKLILQLKENSQKQQAILERKDEEIVRLEVEREMLERKTTRYLEEIKSLRKSVDKIKDENKKLKSENIELSVQISKLMAAVEKVEKKQEKEKIEFENGSEFTLNDRDDLKTIEKSFKNLLAQKEQIIQYQEKTIIDLRSKIDVFLSSFFSRGLLRCFPGKNQGVSDRAAVA